MECREHSIAFTSMHIIYCYKDLLQSFGVNQVLLKTSFGWH